MMQWRHNRLSLLVVSWIIVSGLGALLIAPRAIGHDQASLLWCGVQIAQGRVPFRDFTDINPPVIHYLSALPAGIAALTSTNPIPWFTVMVVLISAWSAVMGDRALRACAPSADWPERLAIMLVPLGPATIHLMLAEPGQREHLFVLLYFPFLMRRLAASVDAPVGSALGRFLVGAAAAIGVTLKPFFLAPVLGFEIGLWIAKRRTRLLLAPEVWGAISFAGVVAAGLALLPAEAHEVLTGQILPILRNGYSQYGAAGEILLRRGALRLTALVVVATAAWLFGPRGMRVAIVPLAGFCLGAVGATFLQGKGFGYHYIPADCVLLLLGALAAAGAVSRPRLMAVRPILVTAILLVIFVWRPLIAWRIFQPDVYPFRAVLARYAHPGDSIMVLSGTSQYSAPAAMQLDLRIVTRQSVFLLMLARQADAAGNTPGHFADRVMRELADDVERLHAKFIFIDRQPGCVSCPEGVTAATLLETDARVQQSLRHYDRVADDSNFDVYRRRD